MVDAGDASRGAEDHTAWIIGNLEWCGGGGDPARFEQHGATRGAVGLGHLCQLPVHDFTETCVVLDDLGELVDPGTKLIALALQLDAGELRQTTQLHVQDVVGLRLGQLEDLDEAFAGLTGILGAADDRDHVIDVEDRDQQTLHKM